MRSLRCAAVSWKNGIGQFELGAQDSAMIFLRMNFYELADVLPSVLIPRMAHKHYVWRKIMVEDFLRSPPLKCRQRGLKQIESANSLVKTDLKLCLEQRTKPFNDN